MSLSFSLSLSLSLLFGGLGFELKASRLQSRHWSLTAILPILASQVARIIGMNP
jgi:hypothetical protein